MKKEHPTFGCSFDIDRIGDSPKLFVVIIPRSSYDFVMTGRTFGNAQASLALLSLLRTFLLGEVRYLAVKKAYPNEAEELHSRP